MTSDHVRNPDVEHLLSDIDRLYGGDTAEYLGPNWRCILKPILQSAWNHGYATALGDRRRIDRAIAEHGGYIND